MPNFMEFLRLKNLFGQPDIVGNDMPSQGGFFGNMRTMENPRQDPWGNVSFGPPTDMREMADTQIPGPAPYDAGARMRELYQPETAASERYDELLGQYPTRMDNEPSKLRRIGSAIIALGQSMGPQGFRNFRPGAGMEAGLEFMNRPYTEKLGDWRNQIGPAAQAATLERTNNTNERMFANQTVTREQADSKLEQKTKNDEEKNRIAADRAEVYRLKSLMPNFRFDFSGPTVLVANPQTGKVEDTKISTGSMSDADKIALQQENSLERIGAAGAESRETENLRQTNREGMAETRGWKVGSIPDPMDPSKQIGVQYNEITGEIKPIQFNGQQTPITKVGTGGSSGAGKTELPTQTKVRQFNSARQLYNTRADLKPFIKLGTNDFTITPPGKGVFGGATGPTPEQYQELQNAIYGSQPAINQPGRTEKPQRMVKTQRNTKTGATRQVESLDGGKTWQPVNSQ